MSNIYTITGATGNIGSGIVTRLLDQGHEVRAVARDENKLKRLAEKGAIPLAGNLQDLDFLTSAYTGADAVFAMIPPHLQSNDFLAYADGIAKKHVLAVVESNVGNVVALSSIGAHLSQGNGIVRALYDFEQRLKALQNVNVLVLRPSYFMENIYMQLDVIKVMGFAGSPVAADVSMPVVATRDVAEAAAQRLTDLRFEGYSVEYLLGQRDVSYNDITRAIGKAIKKTDLKYVQFPPGQAARAMVMAGLSENVAGLLVGLADGINNGRLLGDYKRNPENTTKTSIEEFARGFARMFEKK